MKTNELSQQEMQAINGGTSVIPSSTYAGPGIETPYDNTAPAGDSSADMPNSDGSVGAPAGSGTGESHPPYIK